DFEQTIGRSAEFSIHKPVMGIAVQRWTGIVSEIQQLCSEEAGLSTYHLTLVPRGWLLTQRSNCRVFQQMTDLEVVTTLLSEWGIHPEVITTRKHRPRKHRVQYMESDYAFASRLLEAAGITLYFRRGDGETTVVLHDAPEQGIHRRDPLEHVNKPMAGAIHATKLRAFRHVRSGTITFADHDHRLPNTPLLAKVD